MASGGKPPDSLNARHKLLALMIACGATNGECAKQLKMNYNRVSIIRQSPLFKVLVLQHQREIVDRGVQETIDKVLADGPVNVQFIRQVRDGQIDCDADQLRIRLTAAGMLFDRQVPRRTEQTVDNRLHVSLENERMKAIEATCQEVGMPLESEEAEVLEGAFTLPSPPARIVPRGIDEVVNEYAAREQEELDG